MKDERNMNNGKNNRINGYGNGTDKAELCNNQFPTDAPEGKAIKVRNNNKRHYIAYTTEYKKIADAKDVLRAVDSGKWQGDRMGQLACLAWAKGMPERRFPDTMNVEEKPWGSLSEFCEYAGLDGTIISKDGRRGIWNGNAGSLKLRVVMRFIRYDKTVAYTIRFY